ncbi:TPA: hypothetical protein ACGAFX_004419 [Escherichia coli]|uniref:hypothetical protein n=1 Tax=Escherichia coli TaxID=562 RepID=UPI0007A0316F|nr:hypothetical protein [Escherichia coli]EAQ5262167.1 hypothetical protein [Salmonella enterica]EBU8649085.1 hypothetical protein [Salmonella enterica subsp. enterica serovar Typhimurium]EBY0147705.1 hypothetical protein [Salmonella enterica subsp. enterica serovar Mississippi]EBZ4541497.1 hypothetical protein [Salmonella enterica subsp. enterica serovar Enteritidis]EDB3032133.1 hypothetical protein [Salmonella enterica subsp. enterica]EFQ0389554.1 hypothetical protein [Shigella sonnei]
MNDCFGCMHPYPAGHWFYFLQDFTPLLENPLFYVFFFFFAGMAGVFISRVTNLIKSMRHDNKPSIDNYEQIEIEHYMTNEEVGRLVINFMKRTNGEPLLIVFPEYDNGDNDENKNSC